MGAHSILDLPFLLADNQGQEPGGTTQAPIKSTMRRGPLIPNLSSLLVDSLGWVPVTLSRHHP